MKHPRKQLVNFKPKAPSLTSIYYTHTDGRLWLRHIRSLGVSMLLLQLHLYSYRVVVHHTVGSVAVIVDREHLGDTVGFVPHAWPAAATNHEDFVIYWEWEAYCFRLIGPTRWG